MKVVDEKVALLEKIIFLENKQLQDLHSLKEQYNTVKESLKPINLIKSSFQEIMGTDLKSNLINGAIGIGTSYLSKNILNENSSNPIKKALGKVLKFAIKNFVGKKTRNSFTEE